MLKVLIYQKPYGIDMHVLSHPGFKILIEISEQNRNHRLTNIQIYTANFD